MLLNTDRRMLPVVRATGAVLDSEFDSSIRTAVSLHSVAFEFVRASSDCCLHCLYWPRTWSMCPVSPSVCPIYFAVSNTHSSSVHASWSRWWHWPRLESSVSTNQRWSSWWYHSIDWSVQKYAVLFVSNRWSVERCWSTVASAMFAAGRSAWGRYCRRDHARVSADHERNHPRIYPVWLNRVSTISHSLREILNGAFLDRNLD